MLSIFSVFILLMRNGIYSLKKDRFEKLIMAGLFYFRSLSRRLLKASRFAERNIFQLGFEPQACVSNKQAQDDLSSIAIFQSNEIRK